MRKAKHKSAVLKPTRFKITLTFLISLLTIIGWVGLLGVPSVHLVTVLIYFAFTFIWIVIAGIAASIFVHHSGKNRVTRILAYVTLSLIFICIMTLIYALLR